MRIFELSPRLQSVADWVPPGACFADIGTDHAYLPVWLVLQGIIDRAIVSDLREGPLQRARQTAERYGVADKVDFRLCDGLEGLRADEADTVAIAGMGGETITAILEACPWANQGARRFLLQPMTAQEELRSWLDSHGYCIKEERLSREGKTLYTTLQAEPGVSMGLTPAETWAGRQERGMDAPLRGAYLDKLLRRAEKAAAGAASASRQIDAERVGALETVVKGLREMKEAWDAWQR